MDDKTIEHLNLLAVVHYILGGIGVFFACFPLIYLVLGIAIMTGSMDFPDHGNNNQPPPEFLGVMFAVMGGIFFLLGQALAWLMIYSGRQIKKRQKRTFSFVIACLMCLQVPFGTVLGVFTIIVLNKDETKEVYENTQN